MGFDWGSGSEFVYEVDDFVGRGEGRQQERCAQKGGHERAVFVALADPGFLAVEDEQDGRECGDKHRADDCVVLLDLLEAEDGFDRGGICQEGDDERGGWDKGDGEHEAAVWAAFGVYRGELACVVALARGVAEVPEIRKDVGHGLPDTQKA